LIGKSYIVHLKNTSTITKINKSVIWDFPGDHNYPNNIIDLSDLDSNWWITIVDPFMGIRPIVLNKYSLNTNIIKL
jgi:hypothetical protein